MVRRQMGLLDDAIRDHLELKRRRGADPGEVASEQSEALPEVRSDGKPGVDDGYAPSAEVTPEAIAAASPNPTVVTDGDAQPRGQLRLPRARSSVDQETAEFDMTAVLNDSPEAPDDQFPPPKRIVVGPAPGSSSPDVQDDGLEWDFPGAHSSARESGHGRPAVPDEMPRD
jgi:hypothetical protein